MAHAIGDIDNRLRAVAHSAGDAYRIRHRHIFPSCPDGHEVDRAGRRRADHRARVSDSRPDLRASSGRPARALGGSRVSTAPPIDQRPSQDRFVQLRSKAPWRHLSGSTCRPSTVHAETRRRVRRPVLHRDRQSAHPRASPASWGRSSARRIATMRRCLVAPGARGFGEGGRCWAAVGAVSGSLRLRVWLDVASDDGLPFGV